MTIKVKLRQKPIKGNKQSLYLDFYPPIQNIKTGELTRREFLRLYIVDKPKTPIEKQHNTDTLRIAESIRIKRENNLNKPEIYSQFEKEQLRLKELGEQSFVDYFRNLTEKRDGSNQKCWYSTLNYLESFSNGNMTFSDLSEKYLEGFKEYLLTTTSNKSEKAKLSNNSALSYFNKVKAALKQAYKDGLIQVDLNARISPIKEAETRREYLTIEELNQLANTPCNNDLLKRTALFSALTGMAFKEIQNLTWQDISHIEGQGYLILTKRQKTQRDNYLPISEQAYSLLGEKGNATDKVFNGFNYSAYQNKHLYHWIGAAGITKNITFHCFRHTFATLQLYNGTDIYTVSKMLGHKDLKTTQVYAKIVDDSKRKAADKIKIDFANKS
ncbi:site-specific recombinase XerD [Breznakibacter xylanolyticus]|uniref:Site-specific recombinase XerD n=1 Tax=Breznakibacter xylanolyticus TaxID=990 RepID=A0A2W7Q449_9BACT|nr:site-specific integrase [Breznakibacter xylanolyticus]PZX16449.1 site-specific recombinase XerD [Breznakibacter xylanolyticus]